MDNMKLYVDLGFGIPKCAVMEILYAMRDNAVPDSSTQFNYFVRCNHGFYVQDTHSLGLCVLANARCIGMEIVCLHLKTTDNGDLAVYFNKR